MRLYRKILSQAWHATWHNKYLWFFGLFAALLGTGGEYEILSRGLVGPQEQLFPELARLTETGFFSLDTLRNIGVLIVTEPLSMISLIVMWLFILVIFIFIVWLVNVSQAAVVSGSALRMNDKNTNFKENLKTGMTKFWPVLGLNILQKVAISLAVIIISLPIILSMGTDSSVFQGISFWILYIIFIPVVLIISFVLKYAIAYVVIKENSLFDAIQMGWQLFVKNWLISIEMAILIFIINILVSFVGLLAVVTVAVPLMFLAGFLGQVVFPLLFWMILILGLIFLVLIIAVVGACIATFQISIWTGLFVELVGRGGVSKLARMFNKN